MVPIEGQESSGTRAASRSAGNAASSSTSKAASPRATRATEDLRKARGSPSSTTGVDEDQGRGQDKLGDEVEIQRKTYIYLWYFYKKVWKVKDVLLVHPKDSSELARKANEHLRVGLRHFDTELGVLSPGTCYKTVVANGTHSTILRRWILMTSLGALHQPFAKGY